MKTDGANTSPEGAAPKPDDRQQESQKTNWSSLLTKVEEGLNRTRSMIEEAERCKDSEKLGKLRAILQREEESRYIASFNVHSGGWTAARLMQFGHEMFEDFGGGRITEEQFEARKRMFKEMYGKLTAAGRF